MHEETYTIILPTRNEAGNIEPMLQALDAALADFEYPYEILFVDDSDDDTPDVIRGFMAKVRYVRLLHRPKGERSGLATAFVDGFRKAAGEIIVCMDADLQHPPEAIPEMAERMREEASDIVVASRYIPGGSAEGLGSTYRIFVSKIVSRIAAWTLLSPTRKTTDPSAGMFLVRKDVVDSLTFTNLLGFKILIDILTRAPWARVSEVPIIFRRRENEVSKATLAQGLNFFAHIYGLYRSHRLPVVLRGLTVFVAVSLAAVFFLATLGLTGNPFEIFLVVLSFFLVLQSSFMTYLMLYAWENPERMRENASPTEFRAPRYSFSLFIPARHEEAVIADTIRSLARIDYPDDLMEVLVLVNRKDDAETIRIASEAIRETGHRSIRLVDFDGPLGKQYGLNVGLRTTEKDVVTIFDAEDEIHPDILNIVNTTLITSRADIVQSGVQLMNYRSNWYSLFNVMEYYFWFKSVLHFFARQGVIPLGGNTVFFKTHWLRRVGGWDERCLTEDADIGLRMSVLGARIKVVYDERHATREETPPSLSDFIKQRTRWNQGFIQVLLKGDWLQLPTFRQRFLALYFLTWLFFQTGLFVFLPVSVVIAIGYKMSPVLGLVANLPLYTFLLLLVIINIGLYQFIVGYGYRYSPRVILTSVIFYIPYQLLLGISALRAVIRHIGGHAHWEKTTHVNAAREAELPASVIGTSALT